MFYPQMVKEFDADGLCTTKLAGVVGKNLESNSIISISASEALSDVLTFTKKDNLQYFDQGKVIPAEKFRKDVKSSDEDDKPWVPCIHPVALYRIPLCIPKLKGHIIETGSTSKPSVRTSIMNYHRIAVDWYDSVVAQKITTKHANYKLFVDSYLPNQTDLSHVQLRASVQPVFEMDSDSAVHQKMSSVLNIIKTTCISKVAPPAVDNMSQGIDQFRTPQKIAFHTPKTPKSIGGDDLASITTEAVKEKAKHSVLFYRLFLSAKFVEPTSATPEIILGNLSETFLAAINAGRSEGIRIFTNAFATYRKDRF